MPCVEQLGWLLPTDPAALLSGLSSTRLVSAACFLSPFLPALPGKAVSVYSGRYLAHIVLL